MGTSAGRGHAPRFACAPVRLPHEPYYRSVTTFTLPLATIRESNRETGCKGQVGFGRSVSPILSNSHRVPVPAAPTTARTTMGMNQSSSLIVAGRALGI